MTYGTVAAWNVSSAATPHFGGSLAAVPVWGQMGYIAVTAFVLNVVVAAILTLILRAAKAPAGVDATQPADYFADEGDPRVAPMPKSVEELAAEGKTQR
jgi:SSS family solute:Na+ symporter